ncbi:efflux RND transporter periplasmic adaptor subunit [Pseudothauera rhizosphaerae]|uniref:Efflux RND transporter periplasmic adaptor subunit n=1 Tax=Pseudothauera rhizosphaerae TaxID=2565932 RepID=A0A4S4AH79_9RHOO|nr:efflux RND transporter periplasmic adaptor subunit [Pseudothauera rhizosphaerae]THF58622.1 efflux RND transporter periplasmic adaptor subunit [Pseudothauera rhizosphaerae]
MRPERRHIAVAALALALLGAVLAWIAVRAPQAAAAPDAPPRPALAVTTAAPRAETLPLTLAAHGDVAAWQEAIIGSDVADLRLREVLVDVGDRVRAGQVLAVFDDEMVRADVARARAALGEAQALLIEARDNAARARNLAGSGAMAQQQVARHLAAEQSAEARVEVAGAELAAQELRLRRTRVLAPDDGVISARVASVGAVVGMGGELFRLLRQGRLEWRAQVGAAELARLRPGLMARVAARGGERGEEWVEGRVRQIAPTVDAHTRYALVYVDLPPLPGVDAGKPDAGKPDAGEQAAALRPGMFARGEFLLGEQGALTVPQQAVVVRDGFSHVFVVDEQAESKRVRLVRVQPGPHKGERVAVQGLTAQAQVVERGGAFLDDGDVVQVVPAGR